MPIQRGTDRHCAKLNEDKVRDIRALAAQGVPRRQLAERYGVSKVAILKVVRRLSWAHVE